MDYRLIGRYDFWLKKLYVICKGCVCAWETELVINDLDSVRVVCCLVFKLLELTVVCYVKKL